MLKVEGLTKSFGEMTAVDNVSFEIPNGKILGLIGQNGAGKSTTFRLILNFIEQDKGIILWDGQPIEEEDYNIIGYLPEERGLYPKVTIEDQLIYFGKLRGKTKKEIVPLIDKWMDKFQVKGKKTDKVKSLSKGNQQKVQLIATLIHEPKLVILDEPFSGLDPVNAELLKQGIIELKDQGSCVIFSSHNMENVEQICDHLVMLRNGEMVLDGKVQDIREQFGRTKLEIETKLSPEELTAIPGVLKIEKRREHVYVLQLENPEVGQIVFEEALKQENYLPVFNQQPPTLEEIFRMKVGEINE
ncbi:ABC transporter ATP-binding protein [Vagococcus carniphilus]|uniref:ABC transporter ATP-binding protein n=1 Tax=Vagococcus carniphilus TaxID=218144 RepID=UPI00288D4F43|nr:ABC transporter ATP-binding protein [Vagococcus carniphilus]MDT2831212.1 ABC transporter ATP-binding protein [Vagococcus carniphilus]MDT2839629.1 ABC transporter ATP-binding protein [Vagococcus carniphilus]MDT2854098.1 ABC transporter ATP-binding protein [Vagococcus carniphilus]